MKKSKVAKKMGRPRRPDGRDPIMTFRLPARLVARLDQRAKKEQITRSAALRNLIERALG
jgi:hypothetical protein